MNYLQNLEKHLVLSHRQINILLEKCNSADQWERVLHFQQKLGKFLDYIIQLQEENAE